MASEDSGLKVNKKILAGAGGLITAFTTVVFAYIDSKTSDIDKRIDDKYASIKDYVDIKHGAVEQKLGNIEKLLIKIDDRIYEITKQKGD